MAVLEKISLQNFRNIADASLQFVRGINCICGSNGQGKTNLLDAIYFLSMTKSAFGFADSLCVRYGAEGFSIGGSYALDGGLATRVGLSFSAAEGKAIRRDGKAVKRASDHIGLLPVVMICPQDGALVGDGAEVRRRFVNGVLSQMDPGYLAAVQRYRRLLQQRNQVIRDRNADAALLDVLEERMAVEAATITASRRDFCEKISPILAASYRSLCDAAEQVDVSYRSGTLADASSHVQAISDAFRTHREKDSILGFTYPGPQRDDFVFRMNGHPLRSCASQGQQKSFLLCLKLSQYELMRPCCGERPILLLDDVFDKLDESRTASLIRLVSRGDYGQIFITDTSRPRLEGIIGGIAPDAAYFEAKDGEF